ncbi:MAG TPA: hypothetical protein DDW23_07085 [Planctomycetes bacterium]|nr:hypothetical protein [Planctomycetota bacterium]
MASEHSPRARKISASNLRWHCPDAWIPPASNNSVATLIPGLFGQERALEALEMGLAVEAPGYNVFLCGIRGAGRSRTVTKLLDRLRLQCEASKDHVFVHNFADSLRPRHLALANGDGALLATAMGRWVRVLQRDIPRILESEEHLKGRDKLVRRYQKAEKELFRRLDRKARKKGLALVSFESQGGIRYDFHFLHNEKILSEKDLSALPKGKQPGIRAMKKLEQSRDELHHELIRTRRKVRALGLRLVRETESHDQSAVEMDVEWLRQEMGMDFNPNPQLSAWLDECAQFAWTNPHLFSSTEGERESDHANPGLEVFTVNVIRGRKSAGCPLVHEQHPSTTNLFGTVEHRIIGNGPGFVHLAVRPGSLLAADGGFLVLDSHDVFRETEVWRALKRTLQTGLLEIPGQAGPSVPDPAGIRPEPIPLDIKVVLIGESGHFDALHNQDEDFPEIFKVRAEFDETLPLTRPSAAELVGALRNIIVNEDLLPLAKTGARAMVEEAVTEAGRRTRLSARLDILADVLREADFWARKNGAQAIEKKSILTARRKHRHQHSLDAEWHRRMTLEDVYEISTEGSQIGILNGLTVISLGPLGFGRPARVAASVGAGEESFTNIERDVDLSGSIHNKGMAMLEGFMRHKFGQSKTLSARMALAFEQSYGPIDGDSASSTEIYALLSALSNIPLRQDLAVTGAVNLRGDVMAVGGVNEKILGFFELCVERGLTGTQGVLIPASNVDDLMLDPAVVESVRKRKFHLWSIEHIDQGIALLANATSRSVYQAVEERLDAWSKGSKETEAT